MFFHGSKSRLSTCVISLALLTLVFASQPLEASPDSPSSTAAKKSKLVDLWQPGDPGQRMNIRGRVTSLDGTPLPGIRIKIRQPDGEGDWIEQYQTTLITDQKGRYQFGSVVPESNYCGAPRVSVTVYQDGFEYFNTDLVFEGDTELYEDEGEPVFLEESTVKGETIMFGSYDFVLSLE